MENGTATHYHTTMVAVVCGIIVREDGLLLIGQRPAGKHLSGQWEFPGGKIEVNETAANAIHRELDEELGCSVCVVFRLQCVHHIYDDGVEISMIPFVCKIVNGHGNLKVIEHDRVEWVAFDKLKNYNMVAADVHVIALYRAWTLL